MLALVQKLDPLEIFLTGCLKKVKKQSDKKFA